MPTVGDEVVLRARVSEFFNLTELPAPRWSPCSTRGLDVDTRVEVDANATRRLDWPTRTGSGSGTRAARCGSAAGSVATSGRDVFASTADPRSG